MTSKRPLLILRPMVISLGISESSTLPRRQTEQLAAIEANSSIIMSRQLQEALGIDDSYISDFAKMYGEVEYDPESGEGMD